MFQSNIAQESGRCDRGRRLNDAAAQKRALSAMGVEVSLSVLQALPPGGWLQFVPRTRTAERRRTFALDD